VFNAPQWSSRLATLRTVIKLMVAIVGSNVQNLAAPARNLAAHF
jgi:hypothetical protein